MNNEEHEKVRRFRDAVERMLTSASNPGRVAAVLSDNAPGSPYHDLVLAKMDVDAMLWNLPMRVLVDPKMPENTVHFSCGPRPEQNVTVTGVADNGTGANDA